MKPINKKELLYTLGVILAITVYLLVLAFFADIKNREWYVDEYHFIPTIRLFYDHPTITTLKTYPEITGPLTYIMYAGWATVLGFSTFTLRIFSMVLAGAVFFLIYIIARRETNSPIMGCAAMAMCMVNPYMAGLSIFVFTDMSMLVFLLLSYQAFSHGSAVRLWLWLSCALLCRQFAGFLLIAVAVYSSLIWLQSRNKQDMRMLSAAILSVVPLGVLFLLWGGPATQEGSKIYLHSYKLKYFNYLVFYIATFWVYAAPLIIWKARELFTSVRLGICSVVLLALYPLFPVAVSEHTLQYGQYAANGYIHRCIKAISSVTLPVMEHILLALLFGAGCYVVLRIGKDTLSRIRRHRFSPPLVLELSFYAFLLFMPMQYQVWEKYLVMIMPFVIFRLLQQKRAVV